MHKKISCKPSWLNKKIFLKDNRDLALFFAEHKVHTVCEEAFCPNISECFSKRTAAFMIMGNICTRSCLFCGVQKGIPLPLEKEEPLRVAEMVSLLGLKYAAITSTTRDDLPDKGASHFAETIESTRAYNPSVKIEALIPDMNADKALLNQIVSSSPHIIAHNIETVKRLYPGIKRDIDRYETSLAVLKIIKELDSSKTTKSGIMLGMGEETEEVIQTLKDIREADCDFLSIGQYLAPSKLHYQVKEYVNPEAFDELRRISLDLGFKSVKSGPYVRSSYLADEY